MAAVLALAGHFELFVMVLCRTTGIFLVAPFFGAAVVPKLVRVVLCGTLAACLVPMVGRSQMGVALPGTWVGFGLVAAKEMGVGLALGFFALLAYTTVQVAGELLSEQMGFMMSRVADPTTSAEVTVIAQLAAVLGLLLFVAVDGHHWLLLALSRSFERVPVGAMDLSGATLARVTDGFARMYESGVVLAAPVLCVTLLTTVAVGVLARVVPQINALMMAFPLKIAVGLLTLGAAMPFIAHAVERQLMAMARGLLPLLGGS